ncbi:restriction endonuclease subunit S [Vibrio alginolyticus]|uniref:restriction endonuclease subunit S n=1 Tax=Vibrio alginolyticus TaxID=663 RepID=UPI001C9CA2DC|nr:restriction endonuclease subunit S [Vibrio alginolyticus]MBY7698444.1 restriction endonuclease subunit S [Vibrio alginolyticus]
MSWEKKPLEQLGVITSSKRIYKKEYVKSGIPFFRTKEVKELANGKEIATELFISRERYLEILDKFGVPEEGDILLTAIGTIGEVYVVNNASPFYFKDGNVLWLKNFNELSPCYLRYALLSFVDELNALSNGAAYNALPIKKLKQHQVFVPPKNIQNEIVTVLDKAFADIDQARANTEQNLQNARELFDSYLQQVFSERGEGWKKFVFSDLCEITSKLVDPRESEFLDYPHIGAANITSVTGELTEIKTAREEQLKSGKFVFDESMVLYSKIRPYLMKTCRPNFVGLCSADIYPLVPNKELITRDFLFYLLTTRHFTDYAISGSSRAGMPKVNRTHLFNYTCHIPSVEEQDMLVEKLNLMMEKSEELQGIYQSKLAALDELKQSLLQQAFTGQLTQG